MYLNKGDGLRIGITPRQGAPSIKKPQPSKREGRVDILAKFPPKPHGIKEILACNSGMPKILMENLLK